MQCKSEETALLRSVDHAVWRAATSAVLRRASASRLQRMGSLAERLEAERSASPKGLALLRGELAQQVQERG